MRARVLLCHCCSGGFVACAALLVSKLLLHFEHCRRMLKFSCRSTLLRLTRLATMDKKKMPKTRANSKSPRTPVALCSAQSTALSFAWRPHGTLVHAARPDSSLCTRRLTANCERRRTAHRLSAEHRKRTICIGNEGRSENARSLRPRRTQIVSGRIPCPPARGR